MILLVFKEDFLWGDNPVDMSTGIMNAGKIPPFIFTPPNILSIFLRIFIGLVFSRRHVDGNIETNLIKP